MALPALVLVHGGGLAADCWDLTVGEIHRQAPELDVLAVDLPGRRDKPGASRVREMVLATAFVPPEGTAVVDTLTGPLAPLARRNAKKGGASKTPSVSARFVYFNGVPRARRRFMAGRLYLEAARILAENVSSRDMPDEVPRTWILTLRDRALSPKSQRRSIAALGGVQTVIPIDTCHGLMVSEPKRLAEILIERCRPYS